MSTMSTTTRQRAVRHPASGEVHPLSQKCSFDQAMPAMQRTGTAVTIMVRHTNRLQEACESAEVVQGIGYS